MASGSVVPPGPTRRRRGVATVGTIVWALIPALSVGLLAPVPFVHAAIRLKQRGLWAVAAAYAIGLVVGLVLAAGPEGGWGDAALGSLIFALMIVGTIHAFVLRDRVFAPRAASPATDPAIAAPLAARRHREEAKAIATRDVALAPEELATRACRFPVGWGARYDPGELRLSDGTVTFTSKHLGQLFQAPVTQVAARYPWPYFGAGLTLIVASQRYRIWFIPFYTSYTTMGEGAPTRALTFNIRDVKPAKAATAQWRAALSQQLR